MNIPVGIPLRRFAVLTSLAALVPLAIWSLRPIPKVVELGAAPSRTESATADAAPQPTDNGLDLAAFRTPLWHIPPPPPPPPVQTAAFVPPPRPLAAKLLAIVHQKTAGPTAEQVVDQGFDEGVKQPVDEQVDQAANRAGHEMLYRAVFFDPALDQVIDVGVEGVIDGFTVLAIDAQGVTLRREEEQRRVLLDPTGVNTPSDPAAATGMLRAPVLSGSTPR